MGKSAWAKVSRVFFVPDEEPAAEVVEGAPTDPAEIERLLKSALAEAPTAKATAASAPLSAPPPPSAPSGALESRTFADIYAASGVPASPYPVEKLLKVLDGLGEIDVAMRKTIVTALDAADESWTIADPVSDARKKVEALRFASVQVASDLKLAEDRTQAEVREQDAYLADATTKIQAEIANLQTLLQQEATTVATKKAEAEARLRTAREVAARETSRLEQESTRLNQIPTLFGTAPGANAT